MSDPSINVEVLAAVVGVSHDTIQRRIKKGEVPAPDIRSRSFLAWRLSTLEVWNPQAAQKIRRGLQHEVFAYTA